MNNIVKQQLKKVSEVRIPEYSDDAVVIFIPKKVDIKDILTVNNFVSLEFSPSLYKYDTVIASNWNSGVRPPQFMIGRIDKSMSNMFLINGCRYDVEKNSATEEYYSIWFPIQSVVSASVVNINI